MLQWSVTYMALGGNVWFIREPLAIREAREQVLLHCRPSPSIFDNNMFANRVPWTTRRTTMKLVMKASSRQVKQNPEF